MSRRRNRRHRILWTLLPVVALLVLGESAARIDAPPDPRAPSPGMPNAVLLHGNPWLLWELQTGDIVEHGNPVHVNAAGFRDVARGPKTRPRALSLGDSSIYGYGVRDDEVFTSVLEQRMDADFIDGGVPGYSTYQSLNLLDMRGLALDPDLLIVGSLWSDNNFEQFVDADLLAAYADFHDGTTRRLRTVLSHSAMFRWLDWTLRVAPQGERARKVGWMEQRDTNTGSARRVGINDYAANLEAFCERMEARGGGIVWLLPPNREDLAPAAEPPKWAPYRQVMRDTAARHHAPLVDGAAAFAASGKEADALFQDQMHPTPLGHRILADALQAALTAVDWPRTPLRVAPADGPVPVYADG